MKIGKSWSTIGLCIWIIICGWVLVLYKYKHPKKVESKPVIPVAPVISPAQPQVPKPTGPKSVLTVPVVPQTPKPITQSIVPVKPPVKLGSEEIHIVFSTDCSFFQDWQTLLVFHSAGVVGQKGPITRIASGCKEDKQQELKQLYQRLYPKYHVHFTPDFKMDEKTKKKYDFYNKPFGVEHWLDNAVPKIEDGVVVALIDPDFIFLRPLTVDVLSGKNSIPFSGNREQQIENEAFMKAAGNVRKGHPAAQRYGLGAPWATHSKNFNRTEVCGKGSPCLNVHYQYGEVHYRLVPAKRRQLKR